jgi:RNA polymerase sigma factor (sigma-70 family)
MDTDQELLQRFLNNSSQEAFTTLVNRHLSLVYHAALRQLGGETEPARDVAQIVFNTLARKASRLASHPSLSGWLFTATRLAALEEARRTAQRRRRESAAFQMNPIPFDSTGFPETAELIPKLDQWLAELNSSDRDAILLRFFDGLPYTRIGQLMGLSEDAARMRVDRALAKLRQFADRKGIKSTAAAIAALLAQQGGLAAPSGLAAILAGTALAGAAATAGSSAIVLSAGTIKIFGIIGGASALAAVSVLTATHFAASHPLLSVPSTAPSAAIHRIAVTPLRAATSALDELPDSSAHVEIKHLDKYGISTQGDAYATEIATTIAFEGNSLGLTDDQKEKVQWAYKRMGETRAAVERSLIQVTAKEDHGVTLTIPAYAGEYLLSKFSADLDRFLGHGMGDRFFSTYRVQIMRDNQGFGEYPQTLTLRRTGNILEFKHAWKLPLPELKPEYAWLAKLMRGSASVSTGNRLPLDKSLGKYEFLRESVPQ